MNEYTVSEETDSVPVRPGWLKRWIVDHEDRFSFLVFYVVAAVVLSLLISLFWLVVVVVVHFMLEWVRHAQSHPSRMRVFGESAWEVKLDVSLVLIALALAVYMPVVFGILGLGTAARAAGASARFIVWQRVIRGISISIDDGLLVMRGVLKRFAGKRKTPAVQGGSSMEGPAAPSVLPADDDGPLPVPGGPGLPSWRARWNVLDWASVVMAVASVGLIVVAPWITQHTVGSVAHELLWDLHPWPI